MSRPDGETGTVDQEATAADQEATAAPERPDAPAGARRDRTRIALYALAGVMLLLLIAALLLGLRLRNEALDDAARRDALAAARQSALNLTSIDQENIEEDIANVLDGATGEFRQDFAARAGELESLLTENDVTAEGRVLEAGLVRSDRRSATALVIVDSTVSNTAAPDGRVNSYRMRLELEKVGDRWLTSSLEFVG